MTEEAGGADSPKILSCQVTYSMPYAGFGMYLYYRNDGRFV